MTDNEASHEKDGHWDPRKDEFPESPHSDWRYVLAIIVGILLGLGFFLCTIYKVLVWLKSL
jgi:hypothetical protein